MGLGEVTNLDASGNIIYDPELADRNYEVFHPTLNEQNENWQYLGHNYSANQLYSQFNILQR